MIKSTPLISILIPTWNRFNSVVELVDSIDAKNDPNIEIVIVDNFSDGTIYKKLRNRFKDDPNIFLYQNSENIGMTANWNKCIGYANGLWMGLMCSDDLFKKGALSDLSKIIKDLNEPALIIQDPAIKSDIILCRPGVETARGLKPPPASGNFWHREITEKIGGYNERLKYSPDVEYWPRIACHYPVLKVKNEFAIYRVHSENFAITTWREKDFLDQIALLNKMISGYHKDSLQPSRYPDDFVEEAIRQTISTILTRSCLKAGEMDIFFRYLIIGLKRTKSFDKKIRFLFFVFKLTVNRIRSAARKVFS